MKTLSYHSYLVKYWRNYSIDNFKVNESIILSDNWKIIQNEGNTCIF